jgi:LCP family protein required for cell wall assembly
MRKPATLEQPAAAAFLSFLFPGLGQAAAGKPRRGAVVAAPMIALVVLAIALVLFARRQIADTLLSENSLLAILLVDVAFLLYRLWAIVDAYLVALPRGKEQSKRLPSTGVRQAGRAVLAVAVLATVGTHLALGAVDVQIRDTLSCTFNTDAPCWFGGGNVAAGETLPELPDTTGALDPTDTPTVAGSSIEPSASAIVSASASESASASASGQVATVVSPTPVVTPGPTTGSGLPIFPVENVSGPNTTPAQWRADGYLNLLLVGIDQGVGRWSLRPDTMILLQVQIPTGKAAMYGIPRNLENIPLPPEAANAYPCHCFPYPNLLNALWLDAVRRPSAYPYAGSDFVRGFKALEGAIGQYLGLHVDGAVVINLMGFANLIDDLGGLDIYVPAELKDSQYSRPQDGHDITIDIKAGQQHMDGLTALAYARSRHQDSDYGRMGRQQEVLMALRKQLNPCELVPRVPALIKDLGDSFWTDMPIDDASTLAALAQRVGYGNVNNVELIPSVTGNPVGYLTVPRWATVRYIVEHGLDHVPASSDGGGSGGGGLSC